jgi:transaldolase
MKSAAPPDGYLRWLTSTRTRWWHDSADPPELQRGLERGAVGVTTNPYLVNLALVKNREAWGGQIREAMAEKDAERRAEALMRIPVTRAAEALRPEFERSGGRNGHVCAQTNPLRAGEREPLLAMARRLHGWAPNIAVKLPATAAGLDVLETCAAEGITAALTVSFTVPQVLAIAEAHRRGSARARDRNVAPGRCFAVLMVGRLDDYLREVAQDARADVRESDIRQAGIAVVKHACALYTERGYETELLPAAMRGSHHITEVAGADLILSIAPPFQDRILADNPPREERAGVPVAKDVLDRLMRLPEFARAYEPDGMRPVEFVSYGATQRTLAQFVDAGWRLMETFAG